MFSGILQNYRACNFSATEILKDKNFKKIKNFLKEIIFANYHTYQQEKFNS